MSFHFVVIRFYPRKWCLLLGEKLFVATPEKLRMMFRSRHEPWKIWFNGDMGTSELCQKHMQLWKGLNGKCDEIKFSRASKKKEKSFFFPFSLSPFGCYAKTCFRGNFRNKFYGQIEYNNLPACHKLWTNSPSKDFRLWFWVDDNFRYG